MAYRYRISRDNAHFQRGIVFPATLALCAFVGACQMNQAKRSPLFGQDTTGYTGTITRHKGIIADITKIAAKWQKNRGDAKTGLNYARHLNAIGSQAKALAILRQTAQRNPQNPTVMVAYGRQLGKLGHYPQANGIFQKAHGLGAPDWRLYDAQAVILDKMRAHGRARQAYGYALKISPRNSAVLNNLGMSYALSGDLKQSEVHLRKALAASRNHARVRQNLALVVGLQGRFKEAEKIASTDLPPDVVKSNMAYLRAMISQPNSWKKLKAIDKS